MAMLKDFPEYVLPARLLTSTIRLVAPLMICALLLAVPTAAAEQPTSPPELQEPAPQAPPGDRRWQYGGFADVGYLRDFNDPANKLFRSRGTAWHVDDLHLNMMGAS